MSSELVWGGGEPASQATRIGLDAKDRGTLPFLLQFKGYHGASSGQINRPLTNHSILIEVPHGVQQQEAGHLCSPFLYLIPHPLPQMGHNKGCIKNTSESVH